MQFLLSFNPPTATAQERRATYVNGRIIFYSPPKVRKAERELNRRLLAQKPSEPMTGALELKVSWMFSRGKSHKHNEWRVTRPDTDNLQKLLKDCMTKCGYWFDDSQVVRETVEKLWVDEDKCGIAIEITQLSEVKDDG